MFHGLFCTSTLLLMLSYINKAFSDELQHQAKRRSKPLLVISSRYVCGDTQCSGGKAGLENRKVVEEEMQGRRRPECHLVKVSVSSRTMRRER